MKEGNLSYSEGLNGICGTKWDEHEPMGIDQFFGPVRLKKEYQFTGSSSP